MDVYADTARLIDREFGLTARRFGPRMHLAGSPRQDALAILRGWISRRWD